MEFGTRIIDREKFGAQITDRERFGTSQRQPESVAASHLAIKVLRFLVTVHGLKSRFGRGTHVLRDEKAHGQVSRRPLPVWASESTTPSVVENY